MDRSRRSILLALALTLTAACRCDSPRAPSATPAAPAAEGQRPAQVLASTDFYRVEATASPCPAGVRCAVELRLFALGAYKINEDYPFKFLPNENASTEIQASGKLEHQGAQRGSLELRFQSAGAGGTRLSGIFKLSVCTKDTCEIAEPEISLQIPAS